MQMGFDKTKAQMLDGRVPGKSRDNHRARFTIRTLFILADSAVNKKNKSRIIISIK